VVVWWAIGARVVVTWRLGEVAPAWQCGGSFVLVRWLFFTDRDESAQTSQCCGPYCDEFNKSSRWFGLQYPSMHIRDEK
jgi:hypothetical protein